MNAKVRSSSHVDLADRAWLSKGDLISSDPAIFISKLELIRAQSEKKDEWLKIKSGLQQKKNWKFHYFHCKGMGAKKQIWFGAET